MSVWQRQVAELPTFVAVLDGADVGMVRGAPDDGGANRGYLISMWVAPETRGRRIGQLLIDAVVNWARDADYAELVLDVANDNAPAVALYTRAGFVPTGVTGTLPAPREHILEHQLALDLVGATSFPGD
jgi:ribosomal protein S18 acetylase RimI-like enzyme